jgi:hypothetical protein
VSVFAQVDSYGNKVFPTKFIAPQVYNQVQDPIDLLLPPVTMGPFDYYNVSNGTWGFAETDVQVSINNPSRVVGTDNRITGYAGPRYVYYSSNAGFTWNSTTSSIGSNQGDPVFTADSAGNFYLCVLNSGCYVYKSVDGGATWTGPTLIVSNGNADKEWICADPTNGTYKNHVYVAFQPVHKLIFIEVLTTVLHGLLLSQVLVQVLLIRDQILLWVLAVLFMLHGIMEAEQL